jgi:hypothetical protein
VGEGWCLLDAGAQDWVVRLAALSSVRGLGERAVPAEARPVTARLGVGSALRGVAESRAETVLHRLDGTLLRGVLGRVGADFVELLAVEEPETVPLAVVAAVRSA